ncbi:MAG: hypothetical protein FJZ95_00445 [Chloroflexi bacterium]|nr:hypothetical protein [Chloroflexota bacterium]
MTSRRIKSISGLGFEHHQGVLAGGSGDGTVPLLAEDFLDEAPRQFFVIDDQYSEGVFHTVTS